MLHVNDVLGRVVPAAGAPEAGLTGKYEDDPVSPQLLFWVAR